MPAKKHKHQNTLWAWFIRVFTGPESFSVRWNDKLNETDPHKNWLSNLEFNLNLYKSQITNSSRYTTANRFEFLDELIPVINSAQSDGNARVAYPTVSSVFERLKNKQAPKTSALYAILQSAAREYLAAGLDKKPVASSSSYSLPQLNVGGTHMAADPKLQEQLNKIQQELEALTTANKKLQATISEKDEQLKQAQQTQVSAQLPFNKITSVQQAPLSSQAVPRTVKQGLKKQASQKDLQREISDIKKKNNALTTLNGQFSTSLQQLEKAKEELSGAKFVNERMIDRLTTQFKELTDEKDQLIKKHVQEKQELSAKVEALTQEQQDLIKQVELLTQSPATEAGKDNQSPSSAKKSALPVTPQAAALALMDKANKDRDLAEKKLVEMQNTHDRYKRDMEAKLAAQQKQAQEEIEVLVKQKQLELAAQAELADARAQVLITKNRKNEAKIQSLSSFIHRLWVWFWAVARPMPNKTVNLTAEQQQGMQTFNDELKKLDVPELTVPANSDVKDILASNTGSSESPTGSRFSWFSSSN